MLLHMCYDLVMTVSEFEAKLEAIEKMNTSDHVDASINVSVLII